MINALLRCPMRVSPSFLQPLALGQRPRAIAAVAVVVLGVLALGGCSSRIFSPFQMEVQQGNFTTEREFSRLREGMTREQVRFVLGTPLVTDLFRNDRWDYVYTRQAQNSDQVELRRITVFFDDDLARRFEDVGVREDSVGSGKR